MFREDFTELVVDSITKSKEFYSSKENFGKPNPFYIGFGNPNSDLLILGKEKGFDPNSKEELEFESINNPNEWSYYVSNNIGSYKTKFRQESNYYLNSYYPYSGKMRVGHTWSKYGMFSKMLYPELGLINNDFLDRSFITEVNHEPAKYSVIKNFTFESRLDFLNHRFYRNFKITILACGAYLSVSQIEKIFDVKFHENISRPRERLIVFFNQDRILINTRQLSMDLKPEYLKRISEKIQIHMNQ